MERVPSGKGGRSGSGSGKIGRRRGKGKGRYGSDDAGVEDALVRGTETMSMSMSVSSSDRAPNELLDRFSSCGRVSTSRGHRGPGKDGRGASL